MIAPREEIADHWLKWKQAEDEVKRLRGYIDRLNSEISRFQDERLCSFINEAKLKREIIRLELLLTPTKREGEE